MSLWPNVTLFTQEENKDPGLGDGPKDAQLRLPSVCGHPKCKCLKGQLHFRNSATIFKWCMTVMYVRQCIEADP